jgi:group II intron reverse transcriptase/maturase
MQEPTLFQRRKATIWCETTIYQTPAGVGEQGMQALGFFRNLGDPTVSAWRVRKGSPENNPLAQVGWRSFRHGSEETSVGRYQKVRMKPEEKSGRKSERFEVPKSQGNQTTRDLEEGRDRQVMESLEGEMSGTLGPGSISTGLQRVAELSREKPGMVWTTLAHHIDLELLRKAYRLTRKDGAVGVDGQTGEEYAKDLEGNLKALLERLKSGTYKAPPVRRTYIPKGDGKKKRPIGIPTFEDKILQRAVVLVLEAVYEQDFLDCSYGSRPRRSAHQVLAKVWQGLMRLGGGFVIEVDVEKFYEMLDHGHLRDFLDKRVQDGVIRRVIGKWLKAGVLEGGKVQEIESGTPQGGVISPLLANIFLHEVVDKWFEEQVKPRLSGNAFMVRYSDDILMVFSLERDARKVMSVLPKRFGRFGLNLHPEKTRLVDFRRPKQTGYEGSLGQGSGPGAFDLLGFTHYWGKTRKGGLAVKRKTAKDRFGRSLRRVVRWCRNNRHVPIRFQYHTLARKLQGYYQYYGIIGNHHAVTCFLYEFKRVWRKWLDRRSQKRSMPWERFVRLLDRYPLPEPSLPRLGVPIAARP